MKNKMDYKNIGRWFGVLDRQSQNYIAEACAGRGIAYQEYVLLLHLYDREGISQEDMAHLILADKAVVARGIKALEEKGFVTRRQDGKDKRVKQLYLMEKGRENETFIRGVLQGWIDFLCEGLDEKKVTIILEGLKYISERALQKNSFREGRWE